MFRPHCDDCGGGWRVGFGETISLGWVAEAGRYSGFAQGCAAGREVISTAAPMLVGECVASRGAVGGCLVCGACWVQGVGEREVL